MLKILNLNTCLLPHGITNANSFNDKKIERVHALFETYSHQYDILMLQEVWDAKWGTSWPCMVAKKGVDYGFYYHYYTPTSGWYLVNNGLMILSKIPITNTSTYTFKNSGGLQWLVPNGVLHARVNEIDLFVTHIHAGSLDTSCLNYRSREIQLAQVVELKKFIEYTRCGSDYIASGDFNTDSLDESDTSETLIDYSLVKNVMEVSSLLEKEYQSTYPVDNFLTNPAFIGHKTCVDHVFTNVLNCNSKIIELKVGDLPISDHKGIEIVLI